MHITVSSVPCDLPKGSTVRDALAAAGLNVRNVLGVRTPTGILELGDELQEDIELEPLTLQDAEGRRIYERSLRFVMLMAIRDLFPGQRVRIEHSVPGGIFVLLPGKVLTNEDVEAIEARMREITRKDLPFEPSFWPQAQVMAYYAERGETDKLELLRHRKASTSEWTPDSTPSLGPPCTTPSTTSRTEASSARPAPPRLRHSSAQRKTPGQAGCLF